MRNLQTHDDIKKARDEDVAAHLRRKKRKERQVALSLKRVSAADLAVEANDKIAELQKELKNLDKEKKEAENQSTNPAKRRSLKNLLTSRERQRKGSVKKIERKRKANQAELAKAIKKAAEARKIGDSINAALAKEQAAGQASDLAEKERKTLSEKRKHLNVALL